MNVINVKKLSVKKHLRLIFELTPERNPMSVVIVGSLLEQVLICSAQENTHWGETP